MTPVVTIEVDAGPIERIGADVAVVGFFRDERPLRGGAGLADWRLCGWLSELVLQGQASGAAGETILIPTFERMRAPRLLVLGLGVREAFAPDGLRAAVASGAAQALELESSSLLLDLPRPRRAASPADWAAAVLAGLRSAVAAAERPLLLRLRVEAAGVDASREAVERAARAAAEGPVRFRLAERLRPPSAPAASESRPARRGRSLS